ncbi:MAG: hypothetical protein QNK54_03705 [Candidatus Planktophila sp.]
MARKKEAEPVAPKVSQIPIPVSDTPVVIDLPDGQKLVIGQLATGSVIEVATWRGTGRPDSRTSRLMLGMSGGTLNPTTASDSEKQEEKKAPATTPEKALHLLKLSIAFLSKSITSLPKLSIKQLNPFVAIEAIKPKSKSSQASENTHGVEITEMQDQESFQSRSSLSGTSTSNDIETWLADIMAKTDKSAKRAEGSAPKKVVKQAQAKKAKSSPRPSTATSKSSKSNTRKKG